MTSRGSYAKGALKRAEILEVALEIIAVNGYSGATVKELAEAVGLSQNGLLHYFGSKHALFEEILRRRDQLDGEAVTTGGELDADEVVRAIVQLVENNAAHRGFVELYVRLSGEASEPVHPSHEYFRNRYETLHQAAGAVFEQFQEEGRISADLDPKRLGTMLFALIDGLQTQWIYDHDSVDMAAEVAYFFELVGVRQKRH